MKTQTIVLIGLIVFLEALTIYSGGWIYFTDVRGAYSVETLNILTYQVTREVVKGGNTIYLTSPPTLNLFTLSILIILILDGIIVIWKLLSMRYRQRQKPVRVRSKREDWGKGVKAYQEFCNSAFSLLGPL